MSNKPWPGPPAGVSTNNPTGGHTAIQANERVLPEQHKKRAPRNGRRLEVGDDPLKNVDTFKVVEGTTNNPTGTNRLSRDVREGPMPKTRRPRRHMSSFESIDGNVYTVRTHDPKGKPLAHRNELCLFLALIEMQKGGHPSSVFEAFSLKIDDADGNRIFPIPAEVLNSLYASDEYEVAEESGDAGFSLGE